MLRAIQIWLLKSPVIHSASFAGADVDGVFSDICRPTVWVASCWRYRFPANTRTNEIEFARTRRNKWKTNARNIAGKPM